MIPCNWLSKYSHNYLKINTNIVYQQTLIRKLLELVCLDRSAKRGTTLAEMLNELSNKNVIPNTLVKVASGLKNFGNIGAHSGNGELTMKEIPIVNALCMAILEYVYSAPYLVTIAEDKLKIIKSEKTN